MRDRLIAPAIAALILAASMPLSAADSEGRYMVKGAGTATCRVFLDAIERRDERFFSFAGWIEGYLSGMNRYESEVYDLVSWQNTDLLMASLAKYCKEQPDQNFHVAVTELAGALRRNAIKERTSQVPVAAGNDRAFVLYDVVVRRIQAALRLRGFYEGELTGEFTDETRDALTAFQASKDLPETGIPDQQTLSNLIN